MIEHTSVDVVMPTYKRWHLLQRFLPSYLSQSVVAKVVIVDDGSDDCPSEEELKETFASFRCPIRLIQNTVRQYQPVCRNIGVDNCSAEFVFFGEDDVQLEASHLSTLVEAARTLDADIVAGRRIDWRCDEKQTAAIDRAARANRSPISLGAYEGYFDGVPHQPAMVPFVHANALVRKSVFDEIRFDPAYAYGNAYREETDFFLTCHEAGKRLFFVPTTACFHMRGGLKEGSGARTFTRWQYEQNVWQHNWHYFGKHRAFFRETLPLLGRSQFLAMAGYLGFRYTNAILRRLGRHV